MKLIGISFLLCLTLSGFARPIKKPVLSPSPLWKKLNSIIIDHVEFEDADPIAIFKLLRIRSKKLDTEGKGVNFIFKGLNNHEATITMELDNISLAELIKYVCLSGGLVYKVDRFAVVIMPKPPKKQRKTE